jgi:hypothetical protein
MRRGQCFFSSFSFLGFGKVDNTYKPPKLIFFLCNVLCAVFTPVTCYLLILTKSGFRFFRNLRSPAVCELPLSNIGLRKCLNFSKILCPKLFFSKMSIGMLFLYFYYKKLRYMQRWGGIEVSLLHKYSQILHISQVFQVSPSFYL